MNKYIITLSPGQVPSAELTQRMINQMIPGEVFSLYAHFYQPDGMEYCRQPLAVSWWRDPGALPSLLLLIDWQAHSAALANRLIYLSQELASGHDTPDHVLRGNLHRLGYTEQNHQSVLAVQELLATISAHDIPITHAFTVRSNRTFGSVVGLELNANAQSWIARSLALIT